MTVGVLNIVFASVLMLFSLSLGMYNVTVPMSSRAMSQMLKKSEADYEARRQADLKAIEEAEKSAATDQERQALELKRKALAARPKWELPVGMDFEKMGLMGRSVAVFAAVDVSTALVLDLLMLAAGIGLVQRQTWGVRLGLAAAAAKLVRLVLVYGYAALVIIPPFAQGSGRVAFEAMAQQLVAAGQRTPPGLDPAFFTRMYSITYTAMAVSMILFGAIYPAISLWFQSRPGARAACEERARHGLEPAGTRVVGILNIVFASSLILFALCMGTYLTVLPILGRFLTDVQQKNEARVVAQQEAARKSVEEALAKAATDEEKKDLEAQRTVLQSKPRGQMVQVQTAQLDLSMLGMNDPKVRAYFWIELTSGLALNLAMIVAGIGLVRRKRWGITLGIGTALAKIVRLVAVYGYFAVAVAGPIAKASADAIGRMVAAQQVVLGAAEPPPVDTAPLVEVYTRMYGVAPATMVVLGAVYPAVALAILIRARRLQAPKAAPDHAVGETW
jgi:hypothetical protein